MTLRGGRRAADDAGDVLDVAGVSRPQAGDSAVLRSWRIAPIPPPLQAGPASACCPCWRSCSMSSRSARQCCWASSNPVTASRSSARWSRTWRSIRTPSQFLHARGIQQFKVYHPADRFWTFQLIEAALFVAVAAVLIGVVVWRVRRRMI